MSDKRQTVESQVFHEARERVWGFPDTGMAKGNLDLPLDPGSHSQVSLGFPSKQLEYIIDCAFDSTVTHAFNYKPKIKTYSTVLFGNPEGTQEEHSIKH